MGGLNLSEHHSQYDKGIKLAGRNSTWNMGQTLTNKQFYLLKKFERLISVCSFRFLRPCSFWIDSDGQDGKKNMLMLRESHDDLFDFFCSACCVFGRACVFAVCPGHVSKCCMANCEGSLFHRCVGAFVCETVWCEILVPTSGRMPYHSACKSNRFNLAREKTMWQFSSKVQQSQRELQFRDPFAWKLFFHARRIKSSVERLPTLPFTWPQNLDALTFANSAKHGSLPTRVCNFFYFRNSNCAIPDQRTQFQEVPTLALTCRQVLQLIWHTPWCHVNLSTVLIGKKCFFSPKFYSIVVPVLVLDIQNLCWKEDGWYVALFDTTLEIKQLPTRNGSLPASGSQKHQSTGVCSFSVNSCPKQGPLGFVCEICFNSWLCSPEVLIFGCFYPWVLSL